MKIRQIVTIVFISLFLPILVVAEGHDEAGSRFINVRIQTLKPGMLAEWEKLRKEQRDGHREAGTEFYHVYQILMGPWDTFLLVTPATAIGKPGTPIATGPNTTVAQSWYSAISATLDYQEVITLKTDRGLRTLPDAPGHPSEKYVHVRTRTALPGRRGDFESWLRNDLIPGLRKADVGDVRVGEVVLGGSTRTWITFSFVAGWPYGEGPSVDRRMLAKGDALAESWVEHFYEFREDLSYSLE